MIPHEVAATRARASAPFLGAIGALGLTVVALTLRRPWRRAAQPAPDKHAALATYLRDHLAGADAAILVVERLAGTHTGTLEGNLFALLHEQFQDERTLVQALLKDLRASPLSIKPLGGHASGSMLKAVADGEPGDLALFRTLEALAIGVQGKRCLWRAAQVLPAPRGLSARRSFVELEKDAVRQWEAIERCRASLVPRTFAFDA